MFKEENGVSCFLFDFIVTECQLGLREVDPLRLSYRHPIEIYILQTMNVDPIALWSGSLSMKRVNSTFATKIMFG
jgi:hypothetical protein